MKTGGLSVLLAIPAFLVPYTFAYDEALMLNGSIVNIVICAATAMVGVYFIGVAVAGYLRGEVNMLFRILMFLGGVLMFVPSTMASLAGLALCVIPLVLSILSGKKAVAAA